MGKERLLRSGSVRVCLVGEERDDRRQQRPTNVGEGFAPPARGWMEIKRCFIGKEPINRMAPKCEK